MLPLPLLQIASLNEMGIYYIVNNHTKRPSYSSIRKLQVIKWESPPVFPPTVFCVISYESWHCITLLVLYDLLGTIETVRERAKCYQCTLHSTASVVHYVYASWSYLGVSCFRFQFEKLVILIDDLIFVIWDGVQPLLMRKSPWNIEKMMPDWS